MTSTHKNPPTKEKTSIFQGLLGGIIPKIYSSVQAESELSPQNRESLKLFQEEQDYLQRAFVNGPPPISNSRPQLKTAATRTGFSYFGAGPPPKPRSPPAPVTPNNNNNNLSPIKMNQNPIHLQNRQPPSNFSSPQRGPSPAPPTKPQHLVRQKTPARLPQSSAAQNIGGAAHYPPSRSSPNNNNNTNNTNHPPVLGQIPIPASQLQKNLKPTSKTAPAAIAASSARPPIRATPNRAVTGTLLSKSPPAVSDPSVLLSKAAVPQKSSSNSELKSSTTKPTTTNAQNVIPLVTHSELKNSAELKNVIQNRKNSVTNKPNLVDTKNSPPQQTGFKSPPFSPPMSPQNAPRNIVALRSGTTSSSTTSNPKTGTTISTTSNPKTGTTTSTTSNPKTGATTSTSAKTGMIPTTSNTRTGTTALNQKIGGASVLDKKTEHAVSGSDYSESFNAMEPNLQRAMKLDPTSKNNGAAASASRAPKKPPPPTPHNANLSTVQSMPASHHSPALLPFSAPTTHSSENILYANIIEDYSGEPHSLSEISPHTYFDEDPDYSHEQQDDLNNYGYELQPSAANQQQQQNLAYVNHFQEQQKKNKAPRDRSRRGTLLEKYLIARARASPNFGRQKEMFMVSDTQKSEPAVEQSIVSCVEFIQQQALQEPGIFRESAEFNRILDLKDTFDHWPSYSLLNCKEPHVVAGFLKLKIREKPPMLEAAKYKELQQFYDEDDVANAKAFLDTELSHRKEEFFLILEMCAAISEHSKVNKMNVFNLAVCWGPTLFRVIEMNDVLAWLILHCEELTIS